MFKKLSTKIIITTLLVMVISSLSAFVLSNIYYHLFLKPDNDARITAVAKEQKAFIESHQDIKAEDFFNEMASLSYQVFAIHDGSINYYGTPFRVDNLKETKPLGNKIYHGIKNRPFNVFITGFFDNETRNTVGIEMKVNGKNYDVFIRPDVGQSMGEFRVFLAVLLTLIILFSVLLVLIESKYIVHPVIALKRFAENIKQGDYSNTLAIRRKDELGVLANEMDAMQQAIIRHQRINDQFVANVSHEIQSPITNLLGLTQKLKATGDLSIIDDITHQSERLSGLTKQMLMLASIENQGREIRKVPFNLKQTIQEVIRNHMYMLDQKDLYLSSDLDDVTISGEQELIYQMLSNLLSNAIKYTQKDGEITITLKMNGKPTVTIEDNGYGMTEETLQRLFERFYKARVNENTSSSNGLGMAIVKEIADLHQATIEVFSKIDKGTKIIVRFDN